MLSHQREVSETLEYGDKLLKDSELPEDDRTAIQKEVLDLSHRWENLEELVSWKSDRYLNFVISCFQKLLPFCGRFSSTKLPREVITCFLL